MSSNESPRFCSSEISDAPLLVDARALARMLSVSMATIWRMRSAGKLPPPVALSRGLVRWRLTDIQQWLADGCPEHTSTHPR